MASLDDQSQEWSTSRLLSTAARLWERELAKNLLTSDLSPAQLVIMQELSTCTAITQADLARKLRITPQTLGRTLRTLETRGCITRAPRTAGQRHIDISLAPAGAQLLSSVKAADHNRPHEAEQDTGPGQPGPPTQSTRILPLESSFVEEDLRRDLIELLTLISATATG
ncbi:MarR family winged helix-turn-helix transcriptional regulator [Arthrobacter sp. CP30]